MSYYDAAQQYVDIMRMAGDWQSTASDTVNGANQTLAKIGKLDADGWPMEDAVTMMVSGGVASGSAANPGPGSSLLGTYQLSFNGIAKLSYNGGSVEYQQYNAATNTTTATLVASPTGTGGTTAQVRVIFNQSQRTAASPVNSGVTNVHVIRPQYAPNGTKWWDSPNQEFTNPFLASLAPFSTLRSMQWNGNIGSQEADWTQRMPPDWPGRHFIQTDGAWEWNATTHQTELTDNWWSLSGQSWESVIDLANVTGKDAWINIPVRATDDYVKSLATLLKQKLNPGIHVYVEYSNEIWNYAYEEYYYIDAQTKALIANNPTAAAAYQKSCISWANDACRSAERLMQISNDFASVWGNSAINDRIRPVFCWQTGSSAMQVAMGYIKETYGAPSQYFYGVCSAPYWTPATITEGESVDDLLAASAAVIPGRAGSVLVYTVTAQYYGLHNLAYEGGPGMDGTVDLPNMIAANLDPRMGQQVTQALTGAFQDGLDMFTYFQSSGGSSQYGMWGATTDVFDLTQPKWQALKALCGQNITRTLAVADPLKGPRPGTTLPGTIDAGNPSFGVINGTLQPGAKTSAGFCLAAASGLPDMCMFYGDKPGGNSQFGYMVVAPKAGSYTVQLKLDVRQNTPVASAQLYVNQQPQGGQVAIGAVTKGTANDPASFTVTLPAGISLIELESTSGHFGVDSIVVTGGN